MSPLTTAMILAFMSLSVVVIAQWNGFKFTSAFNKSSSNKILELVKRDANHNQKATEDHGGFFFTISHFFERRKNTGSDEKPEFINTFDIIRLLDEDYAMKQFFCVINRDPCDEVGLRLKASIPEELNRNCERCTSTEMKNIRRIFSYVKKHYPEFWSRVEPIYKKDTTTYREIIFKDMNNHTILQKA